MNSYMNTSLTLTFTQPGKKKQVPVPTKDIFRSTKKNKLWLTMEKTLLVVPRNLLPGLDNNILKINEPLS